MDPHFHWHSSHSVCVYSCVSSRVSLTCIPVRIPMCNCMRILLVSCEYMLTDPSRRTSISHSKVPQQRKYTTSFIPLVYLFCKQHETDGACLMMMEALNLISVKYYNQPLQPGATCSDHSDAFRKAYLVRILLVFEYVSLLLPLSYPCCILFVTMYVSCMYPYRQRGQRPYSSSAGHTLHGRLLKVSTGRRAGHTMQRLWSIFELSTCPRLSQ